MQDALICIQQPVNNMTTKKVHSVNKPSRWRNIEQRNVLIAWRKMHMMALGLVLHDKAWARTWTHSKSRQLLFSSQSTVWHSSSAPHLIQVLLLLLCLPGSPHPPVLPPSGCCCCIIATSLRSDAKTATVDRGPRALGSAPVFVAMKTAWEGESERKREERRHAHSACSSWRLTRSAAYWLRCDTPVQASCTQKRPHRQGFAVHIWNWYNIFC